MTAEALLWMIGRATLFTSASALAAALLLGVTKIRAPRLHLAVWALVVVQVWLLVPIVWQVEQPVVHRVDVTTDVAQETTTISAIPTPPTAAANSVKERRLDYSLAYVFAWLAGGLMSAVSYAWRYWRFVRQLPIEPSQSEVKWTAEWERQCRAAKLRGDVELRVTNSDGPLVCFVPWRYLLLVPRNLWELLGRRERSAILRHEIAHLVRGDLWWSLAIRVLALPQWFNPLVWLAVRRFDEAGEWACDDWVSRGNRGRELTFARSLVAAAEYASTGPAGTASVQGGKLARRVRRLVLRQKPAETTAKKLLVVLPLALIVAAQTLRIEYVQAEDPLALPTPVAAPGSVAVEPAPYDVTPSQYVTPPQYVIEPPDILLINAVKLIPKSPHRLEPFDALLVRVLGALPDQPIADVFSVDADGTIDLGPTYGKIDVSGLTVDEAQSAVKQSLENVLEKPQVSVSLAASAGAQQIQGKHLVGPDGRVNLGVYGTVYVSGMTVGEARGAIEKQLAEYLQNPQVVVDVASFNSKKYYVITRGPGRGDNVTTAPISGNETVLDAMATVDGLSQLSSKRIWIARPAPNGVGREQVLPVNWDDITQGASTATNYQLLPGDRVFVTTSAELEGATTSTSHGRQVSFAITIIEDPSNNLAEFESKRSDASYVGLDSKTIQAALGILARNKLITRLNAPSVTCLVGQTATVEIGAAGNSSEPSDKLKLEVSGNERDGEFVVRVHLDSTHNGRQYEFNSAVPVLPGQTVLVRASALPTGGAKDGKPVPLYVALTPTISSELRGQNSDSGNFPSPAR